MKCPRCQHNNPQGARFCEECATPLSRSCSNCGTALSATAKFCHACAHPAAVAAEAPSRSPDSYTPKHLAEKILTSKAALEGERKQVTVLFADLKGSMELLADRDPEEARKLLDPVLELMMEAVHRYEGTVNQVMGDGIMALFGAPLAHEDHAVRACYAALRMQEQAARHAADARRTGGANVKIRVGLNSGEVVVRAIGSDLHMDYTAVGQTTHLAARMEQIAAPGSILIAAETHRHVDGYVEVRPLGGVAVKGLADEVEAFELTGASLARTRLQAAAPRGLTSFVGRDEQVEHLRQALARASAGHGQVVALVGEPGVGKSRLTYEFTRSEQARDWLILQASSLSYGKTTGYLPIIDLLKGYFRIGDQDDHREMHAKVQGAVRRLDPALEPLLSPLLALLDVPVEDSAWQSLDPPLRRQRTLEAVKHLLLRESQAKPVLAVFEDLHWVDYESQALLDSLVESLGSARLLLLVTYRPEYEHRWGSKTVYSQLRLDSLPPESAAELLATLLGPEPGLDPLTQMLVRRGNPFFLEETVRTLAETGALTGERGRYQLTQPLQALRVPATVQAILAARIDRLAPEDKRLLQVAAVIGKDVPVALLEAVADLPEEALGRGLDHLRAAEFVYQAGLFPDLEYTFKHALTHEVAYGGLLQERRRELHARVVTAIEALHRDRLGEQVERLAYHAVRGELREHAVPYLRQAGLKAAARSVRDARAWFEQARELCASLPESAFTLEQALEIRLELHPVLIALGEVRRALEALREAETLAERLNDEPRQGWICVATTRARSLLGELDEALASGTRALEIAGRIGDPRLRFIATASLGGTYYYGTEYERVVALATDDFNALPAEWVSEPLGALILPSVLNRGWLTMSLAELGRFSEAAEAAAEAIRLAAPPQNAWTVGQARWAAGTLYLLRGDWATARPLLEHVTAVTRAANVTILLTISVVLSAWVLAQLGEVSQAQSLFLEGEQFVERQAASGFISLLGWLYTCLGRAALLLGRLDEARHMGDRAIESSARQPGFVAHARHLLGDIAAHPDRFDAERAEAHYLQALTLAESRGMRPLVAHCHLGLGKLYRRTGKRERANEHLATATTMYREMGMTYWLEKAERK